jgi:hypothetical protein
MVPRTVALVDAAGTPLNTWPLLPGTPEPTPLPVNGSTPQGAGTPLGGSTPDLSTPVKVLSTHKL